MTKTDKFLNGPLYFLFLSAFSLVTWTLARFFPWMDFVATGVLVTIGLLIVWFKEDLSSVIAIFCFFVYSHRFTLLKAGDVKYLTFLGIIAVVIVAVFVRYLVRRFRKKTVKVCFGRLSTGMACGLIAVSLCGLFFKNYNKVYTLLNIAVSVAVYLLYFLTLNSTRVDIKTYSAKMFVFIGGLAMLEMLVQYADCIFLSDNTFFDALMKRGELDKVGWGMCNVIAVILLMASPLSFYLFVKENKPVYSILPFVFFFGVLLTGSRGNFGIGIILLIITMFITYRKTTHKLFLTVPCVALLATIAILVMIFPEEIGKFVEGRDNFIVFLDNGRMSLYGEALEYFKSNPIFGIGYHGDYSGRFQGVLWKFHCTPLQILASNGIIGVILFIPFYFQRYKTFFKPDLFAFYVLCSVLSYELYGLVDLSFFMVYEIFAIFVFMAAIEKEKDNVGIVLTEKGQEQN